MIKKAVLLLLLAPFLMVFSPDALSDDELAPIDIASKYYDVNVSSWTSIGPSYFCRNFKDPSCPSSITSKMSSLTSESKAYTLRCSPDALFPDEFSCYIYSKNISDLTDSDYNNPLHNVPYSDDKCSNSDGTSYTTTNAGVANYLSNGGSVRTNNGACSVTAGGGVTACSGTDDDITCSFPIESESTGKRSQWGGTIEGGLDGSGTFSVIDFNTPEYLEPLPGGCSDSSSCVTIGDTDYMVDWESAPDYFSYVDDNGTVHSKPSSGGGSGGGNNDDGDTGGADPTDPDNPDDDNGSGSGGNDSGGGGDGSDDDDSDNGGGSGGGSTVPDFEFDESGIIEAIGSAGQSNQDAINALSNDVTSSLNSQTNDLKAATEAQTETLTDAIKGQSDAISDDLESLGDTVTTGIDEAIGEQTEEVSGLFEGLGKSLTSAFGLNVCYEEDGPTEEGHSAATDDKGLLGCIQQIGKGMMKNLANRLTEDLGDGNDLFDSSSMDDTLDGVSEEEAEYGDEVRGLMDEIGEAESSSIAEQVTSRLPSLPSGGCTPMQFGPMEISCLAFTTIQQWLTWIVYFWTVVSVVDTFFRSSQRTA
ncbi:hypothetical protein [Vreelandella gomseomensis]|uniref:Uncharacterized protein n=1 Tax=Vreelandella gomseomensis TaxID=370766 RepID=A0ABU1GDF4_9GAMM|nr:hypothetical protein [Halomonas gomseomensis]MDR5875511.1 hypothetical protein [Halomonas gomseomensis]